VDGCSHAPSPYDHDGSHGPHASHAHLEPQGPHGCLSSPRDPGSDPAPDPAAGAGSSKDLVRWAAFSCLLVPVVLIGYGGPVGGAALAAGGLAVVTVVCRLLLRRSERTAARDLAEDPQAGTHRGRHSRTGSGTHRGGRRTDT
jgi:hypothetical protein